MQVYTKNNVAIISLGASRYIGLPNKIIKELKDVLPSRLNFVYTLDNGRIENIKFIYSDTAPQKEAPPPAPEEKPNKE